jgi:hypothetical protein
LPSCDRSKRDEVGGGMDRVYLLLTLNKHLKSFQRNIELIFGNFHHRYPRDLGGHGGGFALKYLASILGHDLSLIAPCMKMQQVEARLESHSICRLHESVAQVKLLPIRA